MKAEHVLVLNGVGDGVGVQPLLENVFRRPVRALLPVHLRVVRVVLKNGRAREAEQLRLREKRGNGLVVFAKLRPVALVKDEHHALVAQRFQLPLIILLVARVQGNAQLLNGRHNHLIGVVLRQQPPHQRPGVGILLHAAVLKPVELLPRLPVQVLAVHHKQALLNIGVVLEQRRGLKRSQRFAAARRVPDVAIAPVLVNAVHNGLHRVNLVRAHHHQLLLHFHQHHVAAHHLGQRALGQKLLGKRAQVRDFAVLHVRVLIHRQKLLIGREVEMLLAVVGQVKRTGAVRYDEQLNEAQQAIRIARAVVFLIVGYLFHCLARRHFQRFQLNLHHGQPVKQQNDIVAVKAFFRAHAQLVHHLKVVLAPVLDVHKGIMQQRAVFTVESFEPAQCLRGHKHIGLHNIIPQPVKLGIRELHPVQRLKLLPEIALQGLLIADIWPVDVLEVLQLLNEAVFYVLFASHW